ncbi:hypothetical protein ABZ477_08450 [Microbacterium sp. NPDC019599]|uniref:hypothetical protein n=1 Tax=Microbacterium sp. NPDC019599 TaxID=3154690 RepID=UPI0033E484BF
MTTAASGRADLLIGRVFGWLAMGWLVGGMLLILAVPPVSRIATCLSDDRPCPASEFGATPWWWGGLWSATLLVAVIVCRPPKRWWTPQDRAGRPKLPGVFSTPEWLRFHSLVALLVNAALVVTDPEAGPADRLGYAAAGVAALAAVVLATVGIRVTASHIPKALHRGIAQGFDEIWLLPAERRLRAAHGGPRVPAPPTRAQRRRRALRWTRAALVWIAWCFGILCALPILVATVVLLVSAPAAEPGPFALLLILVWVPWALALALAVTFVAGIRHPLDGPRGGPRVGMLGLVVLVAAAATWYLVLGTPFFGGFRWGLDVLLALLGALAVAIVVRIVAGRVAARRRTAGAAR